MPNWKGPISRGSSACGVKKPIANAIFRARAIITHRSGGLRDVIEAFLLVMAAVRAGNIVVGDVMRLAFRAFMIVNDV